MCLCLCDGTNGNVQRCHSSLQIKHLFGGNCCTVCSGGWNSDLTVLSVFIVIFLSPAVLHWLCVCVCVCVSRSNCVTSVRFCTLWSLCSYPACACLYQRDNCIRWCWEYEKIGNDRFSPFFTAVVEFPNYVITLSLLRPLKVRRDCGFSFPVLFRISNKKREIFFVSENVH